MLVGALDAVGLAPLREAVDRLDDLRLRHLVVDLRGLHAIDASAVHALLQLAADTHARGRELSLVRPPDAVMRTFVQLAVDEHFAFVPSPDRFLPPGREPG